MAKGLFIGLCGLDIVFYSSDSLVINEKIKTNNFKTRIGGPAANAALTFNSFNQDTTLISAIGNPSLKEKLKDKGVNVVDIRKENTGDISAVLVNKETGERTILSGQKGFNDKVNLNELIKEDYDFCLCDCNIASLSKDIVSILKERNIPLVLDCGSYKDNVEYLLEYADIVISSSNFNYQNKNIFELQKMFNIKQVARTNNSLPIEYSTDNEKGKIEINEVKKGDTLSAGDIFHGAFCYYYFSEKNDFKDSLRKSAEYTGEIIKCR